MTTAAVQGQDLTLACQPPPQPVKTHDLKPELQEWLGVKDGVYTCEVELDVRVGPDANRDTVERMTKLPKLKVRVVDSDVPAVVLGYTQIETLEGRKNENLEFREDAKDDAAAIKHRLDEVLDAARLEGMSEAGLREGREMIEKEFYDTWRVTLGPGDYADVPPLEIELENPEQSLPKPYTKRYTKGQLTWWRKHIDNLLKANIIRKTTSKDLSPANLVDKWKDGVAQLDDYRMVIDLRARNSNAKTHHYHLPRLDDLWHHLVGAKCFAAVDATKGYLQFLLAVKSRKYAAFLTPFAAPSAHTNYAV